MQRNEYIEAIWVHANTFELLSKPHVTTSNSRHGYIKPIFEHESGDLHFYRYPYYARLWDNYSWLLFACVSQSLCWIRSVARAHNIHNIHFFCRHRVFSSSALALSWIDFFLSSPSSSSSSYSSPTFPFSNKINLRIDYMLTKKDTIP